MIIFFLLNVLQMKFFRDSITFQYLSIYQKLINHFSKLILFLLLGFTLGQIIEYIKFLSIFQNMF